MVHLMIAAEDRDNAFSYLDLLISFGRVPGEILVFTVEELFLQASAETRGQLAVITDRRFFRKIADRMAHIEPEELLVLEEEASDEKKLEKLKAFLKSLPLRPGGGEIYAVYRAVWSEHPESAVYRLGTDAQKKAGKRVLIYAETLPVSKNERETLGDEELSLLLRLTSGKFTGEIPETLFARVPGTDLMIMKKVPDALFNLGLTFDIFRLLAKKLAEEGYFVILSLWGDVHAAQASLLSEAEKICFFSQGKNEEALCQKVRESLGFEEARFQRLSSWEV